MKTPPDHALLRFALPRLLIICCATLLLFPPTTQAQRQMEHLGRGVVAVRQTDDAVFVGWRLLGSDPEAMAFNLYRASDRLPAVKLNVVPIATATHFVDRTAELQKTNTYFVRPVLKGAELPASAPFVLPVNSPVRQ